MLVKVVDNQLWIENSIRKDSLISTSSFEKKIAIILAIFMFGIGNNFGQTFTTIGTSNGSNTSNSHPCPLADYWENHRTQYLIRASELTAAGILAGASISSIRFNVTAASSNILLERLSIYVGGITATSLGTTFLNAPILRYGPINYTPLVGNNTFTFSSNYIWNGTENILVQICNGSSTASSSVTYTSNALVTWQSGLTFNASLTTGVDDNNTLCASTTVLGNQTTRPLITFGWVTALPIANFVANQTNVAQATIVSFTDQSTGNPTSWAWSISPASGWNYTGGTSASSQNPQVTFNSAGQYSVTLTATNSQGSDSETKTNYIIVTQGTGPCVPSVTSTCDEYIQNVTLNTINNTTTCTSGGYASYTTSSTSLTKGSQYTVTVVPATGTTVGQAYTDDEIAVWIDYNNDFTFSTTERVGYVLVASGWSNQFTFTVPTSAITGSVRMRVRISYQPDGAIDPCAVATYGETEDYTINIINSSTTPNSPSFVSASTSSICLLGQSSTLIVNGSVGTTYWFAGSCGNSIANSIGSGTSLVISPTTTTTYYARNYSNGQWSSNCASTTVSVNIATPPNNPTNNSPQCSTVTITRSGTPPSGTTWYWQGTNANGTSTTLGSGTTYNATATGTYYLRAQNSLGCWSSTSGSTYVTLLNAPDTPLTPTSNSPQCDIVTIARSGTPPSGTNWYWQGITNNGTSTILGSDSTYTVTNSGTYYIRAQNSSGCWSNSSASIEVIRECELKIPIAISPNGDMLNDTWDIVGIDEIVDFKIEIFDLSGNLVYAQFGSETNGVYTPFVGKNNNDVDIIDGDYIYSLKSKNKDLKYAGILTIKRK
jgi:gliding motility-associated-like protein